MFSILAGSIPLQQLHSPMILLIEGDLSKSYVGLAACERSQGCDESRFHTRTNPKLQNDSTFDKLSDAAGPLVVPATSLPVSCDLQGQKKMFLLPNVKLFYLPDMCFLELPKTPPHASTKTILQCVHFFCGIDVFSRVVTEFFFSQCQR